MNMNCSANHHLIDESLISLKIRDYGDHIEYEKQGYGLIVTKKPIESVRLELLIDASGLNQEAFSDFVGISQPTLSRLKNGQTKAKGHYFTIAEKFNISSEWLAGIENDVNDKPRLIDSVLKLNSDDFIVVQRHILSENEAIADNNNTIMLHASLLRQFKPKDLRFIIQNDNAMLPLIKKGAAVTFSLSNESIQSGSLYALQIGDDVCARYVFNDPDGSHRIRAADSNFPEYIATADSHNIKIIGRVVTVTNTY